MLRVAALATLAVLAATQPAGAHNSAARSPDLRRWQVPGKLRAERGGDRIRITSPRPSPRNVVADAIGRRNVRAFAPAVRSYLASTADPALPRPAAPAGSTIRYGVPAYDLDGDRLHDVLDIEAEILSLRPVRITARRGTNGRAIWSLPIDGDTESVPLPVGDVTGDRRGDILLTRFDLLDGGGAGSCLVVCMEAGAGSYRWTVSVLSGTTGRAAWTRTFDGQLVFESGHTGATDGDFVFATNGIVVPFLSGDHDGDRVPDVIVDAFDAMQVSATNYAGAAVEAPTTLIGTHATVVSGRTGHDLFTRDQLLEPGGAFLLPSADATGDGRGDLLWQNALVAATPNVCTDGCWSDARARIDVEMIDGARMQPVWTRVLDDPALQDAVAIPADADPTADGRADVYLYRAREPLDEPASLTLGLMSGTDGAIRWDIGVGPDTVVDAIGRPNGLRGDDVLASSFVVLSEKPLRVALLLDRFDGRNGRRVLRTRRVFSDTRTRTIAVITASVFADANADGVADVVVDAIGVDTDLHDLTSSSEVESGRTGRTLWSRRANGFAIAQPAGDATSDGSADLLDIRLDEDDIALALIDLAPVRLMWASVQTVPDGFLALTGGDQSGRGGDDQVFSRLRVVPQGILSRIDGLEARSGRFEWGAGHTLPPRSRGKIAGTVRDSAGRSIADICAFAYKMDGTPAGLGATSSNGTYHVGRLADGQYKVRFADCGIQRYRERWYKQQSDMRSAHVVTVRNGGKTSGIDAVLVRT